MLPAAAWEAQMYIQTPTLGSMSLIFMHFLIIKHVLCLSRSFFSGAVCDNARFTGWGRSESKIRLKAVVLSSPNISYLLEAESMFGFP